MENLSREARTAIRILRKHNAPSQLVTEFAELVQINSSLKFKATVRELLIDACRRYNFSAPFSMDGIRRHFRARLLNDEDGQSALDSAEYRVAEPDLRAEQAYRRGYDQGFAAALRAIEGGTRPVEIKKESRKIHEWRMRPIQIVGSSPGSDEKFGDCLVVPRGMISVRTRFKVFQRDGFKCQICGRSQTDGVVLHVDHKRSISDGGDDDMTNLQTLCSECNLGKSADSMN